MAFGGLFAGFRPAFDAGSAVALPWWYVAGVTCVAAYQPKGAASLAASYVNLANPGTYDAAPGNAPAFDTATGWTFDGIDDYLNCQYAVTETSSIVVYVSAQSAQVYKIIWSANAGDYRKYSLICHDASGVRFWNNTAAAYSAISYANDHHFAFCGHNRYVSGVLKGSVGEAWTGNCIPPLTIGNDARAGGIWDWAGTITAFAIYDTVLSDPQVATLSAAMAAL